jgi:type IX secretion system PorP/SprF family membrane protein
MASCLVRAEAKTPIMKTKIIFTLMLCLLALMSRSQENRIYSLYMFSPLVLNPAYAGNQNQFQASFINRSQWINVDGAPQTQLLTAHVGSIKRPVGVGMVVSLESIGVHKNSSVNISYAYQIKGQDFKLAFGLQGGVNFNQSNYSALLLNTNENLGNIQTFSPNFGFGVFYNTRKFYAGLSVPYFFQNSLVSNGTEISKAPRYYFVNGGRIVKVSKDIVFKPSFLLRFQQGTPINFDISGTIFYKKILSGGLSYRSSGAVVLLTEFQVNRNLRFGYAYDFVLNNKLGPYTGGAHEILLSYRIDLTQKPCHTYF